MKTNFVILLLASVCFASCGKREEKMPMHINTNVVLKVSVLQSGQLMADGSASSLAELDARMTQIQSQNGIIWYFREGGLTAPPPIWKDVMDLVVKHRLPISMSSKADFSDFIDDKGNSRLRK